MVQFGTVSNVFARIGNMHEKPVTRRSFLHFDGIVEILRVFSIDRYDRPSSKIGTSGNRRVLQVVRLILHLFGKYRRNAGHGDKELFFGQRIIAVYDGMLENS